MYRTDRKAIYYIVQSRWIKGSDQSGEFVVDHSTRIREARGLVRHQFNSQMEMMVKHDYPFDDFHIDEENYSITLADETGLWFHTKFFLIEGGGSQLVDVPISVLLVSIQPVTRTRHTT